MISPDLKTFLEQHLSAALSRTIHISGIQAVGGGSINDTFQLRTDKDELFFLKTNDAGTYPGLFSKERLGLDCLQPFVRTPAVLLEEIFRDKQLLIMEWISAGARTEKFWQDFGAKLALLHQQTANAFGLDQDNYMGSLPQANGWRGTWADFFREQRLEPQVRMATRSGLLPLPWANRFERLYAKLSSIFPAENPSLLHGDLWSGNFMCSQQQEPVLIDPAVYYGHRSMDLAMTTLFGRFDQRFYEAYHHHFPFPQDYEEQWEIANLYPLLIHLNLFGSSYLAGITETLERF